MTVLHVLAHHDDEYLALPLILSLQKRGLAQQFVFMTDSGSPKKALRRQAETRAFLRGFGLDEEACWFVGFQHGFRDGELVEHLQEAFGALQAVVRHVGSVAQLVCPAWEGGHPDHDSCAVLATLLAARLPQRPPVEQFGLYNGRGSVGPIYRACTPLPENGPRAKAALSAGEWLRYAAAVRHFPSQVPVFSVLWPTMFAAFAGHRGFWRQTLEPTRVLERPHAGKLLYERTHGLPYAEFRQKADALIASAGGPQILSGVLSASSLSQAAAEASDGMRQSPRGDSEPPEEILGPLGMAERLN